MKALLVIVASLFFATDNDSHSSQNTELTDSFIDVIKSVTEEEKAIVISFRRHAAFYKVSKIDPKFVGIKAKLEKAQKIDKKIKVVAQIPSMMIKEILV